MRQIRKLGTVKSDALSWEGCGVMKTASDYRTMAEECFRWASEATRQEVRESYMQLAQVWLNAASLVDGATDSRRAARNANQSGIVKHGSPMGNIRADMETRR
jgi:hypothetical protein